MFYEILNIISVKEIIIILFNNFTYKNQKFNEIM